MTPDALRALQTPLKQRYRTDPASALITSHAIATLTPGGISCRVESGSHGTEVGLHPATGGVWLGVWLNRRLELDGLSQPAAACFRIFVFCISISMCMAPARVLLVVLN
jgi:hypothetical protein